MENNIFLLGIYHRENSYASYLFLSFSSSYLSPSLYPFIFSFLPFLLPSFFLSMWLVQKIAAKYSIVLPAVPLLSHVQLRELTDCNTPGFLSFSLSQSLLRFMPIESVMP